MFPELWRWLTDKKNQVCKGRPHLLARYSDGRYAYQLSTTPRRQRMGIITALPLETVAVETLLNDVETVKVSGSGGGRQYKYGNIFAGDDGLHHVVLSRCGMGNNQTASRATLMLEHFPTIDFIIMCGIAGGVPHTRTILRTMFV